MFFVVLIAGDPLPGDLVWTIWAASLLLWGGAVAIYNLPDDEEAARLGRLLGVQ